MHSKISDFFNRKKNELEMKENDFEEDVLMLTPMNTTVQRVGKLSPRQSPTL